MSSIALYRPGVAVGRYPQRDDIRDNWLERTAAETAGFFRQHLHGRQTRYWRFVKSVDQVATEKGLADLSNEALRSLTVDLRRRLYSEGLRDQLIAFSFALVREVAIRQLGLRHHDVQLFGGWVMLKGMVAEMETGEGKTLTATLPAVTAALAGIPVHVITVNDFLVTRDADWMTPVYKAMGLTVGTITEEMTPEQRQVAYACDITYCTNKQVVFDYLKDRILLAQESRRLHMELEGLYNPNPRKSRLLMRGLCFAIVDEADSVLVDEARTPLIISKSGGQGQVDQQNQIYREALTIAEKLEKPRDFSVRSRERQIELTDLGKAQLKRFSMRYGGVWKGRKRREDLIKQALSALHLFELDKHYLVKGGKVQIIDEFTGRVMEDRSWERGLHQMIESKEGCDITGRQETLARISYQRFFRRYMLLSGMTGTAHEVAQELWSVYRLNVVSVPTNRPVQRMQYDDQVFKSAAPKWRAIVDSVKEEHRKGRPVLIGTRSVVASEQLSKLLHLANLPHQVLNARQDQEEAEIVARAGQRGRITVATNMAGRGTDIKLDQGVQELGGLHVLGSERHEARRIDRQLFGRGGRQGDPGSYQAFVSLDDELVQDHLGSLTQRILAWALYDEHALPTWLGKVIVYAVQRFAEGHNSRTRKDLLKMDDNLGDMLAFSGRGE
ncbi:preprotein translocase subunit SecA [Solemya velesiana gill symbiont]|uniref:Protein translocase subunit SecA n=1 Tax=Solemya velesiana gill symbiont TaxID=1918948 RepID=A0A1T2KXW1_9GAMM|nr:preprotein translocase subunit SecA [Solemya velesiana gill symbiont]OOZ37685.1 prepilin peptidase [Solemya velesiana gill symbiont]